MNYIIILYYIYKYYIIDVYYIIELIFTSYKYMCIVIEFFYNIIFYKRNRYLFFQKKVSIIIGKMFSLLSIQVISVIDWGDRCFWYVHLFYWPILRVYLAIVNTSCLHAGEVYTNMKWRQCYRLMERSNDCNVMQHVCTMLNAGQRWCKVTGSRFAALLSPRVVIFLTTH